MEAAALKKYCHQVIDAVSAGGCDIVSVAGRVRQLTTKAIVDESFLWGCSGRILDSIEASRGVWRNAPIFANRDAGILMRVFFWPPGNRNQPHLHSAWTVTGVLHNEIGVETFRGATSVEEAAGMTPECLTARAGDCGRLLPPCVHLLHNPTSRESVTFHVFAKEERSDDATQAPASRGAEGGYAPGVNLKRSALLALAAIAGRFEGEPWEETLARVFALGDAQVKLSVVRTLAGRDPERAYAWSRKLESALRGREREHLSHINERLARLIRGADRRDVGLSTTAAAE